MRLQVLHETHYLYTAPVALSQQLLHLTPRALPWQVCREHRLEISPAPGERSEREDYFGNTVTQILIAAPHSELRVRATSTLEVAPREQAALGLARGAWEAVRDATRAQAPECPKRRAGYAASAASSRSGR